MTRARQLGLGLLAATALGIAWTWLRSSSHEPAVAAPAGHAPVMAEERGASRTAVRSEPTLGTRPSPEQGAMVERPHPITSHHEAMAERRELIGALVGALGDKDYAKARHLLSEADALGRASPNDTGFGDTVQGYRLILDCLAARGSAGDAPEPARDLIERSRRYLEAHRLPPRREVRRVCLEGRPFARRT